MLILVPDEGAFTDFESKLDAGVLDEIGSGMSYPQVNLWMPRFTFSADFMLKPTLSAMGMTDAFDDSLADFSGMTGSRELYISEVIHKAFVAVDEVRHGSRSRHRGDHEDHLHAVGRTRRAQDRPPVHLHHPRSAHRLDPLRGARAGSDGEVIAFSQ